MQATNDVFVPDLWNVGLEKKLLLKLIFAKWTERKYEGVLERAGDQVRISTIGSVSTHRLDYSVEEDRRKFENDLGEPQGMSGASITLAVNQILYYQIQDSDLASKLRNKDLWGEYQDEAVTQVSNGIDSFLATYMEKYPLYNKTGITIDVNNVCKTLTAMRAALKKKNVDLELKMEVPFEFIDVLLEAYENAQADNKSIMESGKITSSVDSGVYHQMIFEGSNNVHQDKDGYYYSALRTKRSLAFVNRFSFSEKMRSNSGFSDILRGYTLYDAKVIKPNEGICLKYKVDTTAQKYVLTKTVASA